MPEWLSIVRLRTKALVRRRQLDRDLEEELAFHATMMSEKRGLSTPEAGKAFGTRTAVKEI